MSLKYKKLSEIKDISVHIKGIDIDFNTILTRSEGYKLLEKISEIIQ